MLSSALQPLVSMDEEEQLCDSIESFYVSAEKYINAVVEEQRKHLDPLDHVSVETGATLCKRKIRKGQIRNMREVTERMKFHLWVARKTAAERSQPNIPEPKADHKQLTPELAMKRNCTFTFMLMYNLTPNTDKHAERSARE